MKNIKEIFDYNHPEESSGYLLWQITMLWQRQMKKELDKIELTHTQFVLLAVLAWLNNKMEFVTQIDLANNAKTDRMMTSKVLRTLENKGYIQRKEHKTDTRAKIVILTDKGIEITKLAAKIVNNVDNDFFCSVNDQVDTFNNSMIG